MLHSSSTEGSASADPHSLPLESFKAVLDMTALALEPERFTDAGSAVVTALASRLACDRVSLGMASRNRVRVRALSHNAEFNHKTDLLSAITASMEEAWDQQHTVLLPAPAGWPSQCTRAHEELRRRYGALTICSLPLWSHGRMVGVLTCERGGDRPFDRPTVELCEAIAGLVGPALDLKRQQDRALPFKVWESACRQIGKVIGGARRCEIVSAAVHCHCCRRRDRRRRISYQLKSRVGRGGTAGGCRSLPRICEDGAGTRWRYREGRSSLSYPPGS